MPRVLDRPFSEFVADLAARTPAPGGGAAAGFAAVMGSALLLMVIRFCRGKKANAAREAELEAVEARLLDLHAQILPLAQRDAASFTPVAAAYRLPQATPQEQAARRAAIAAGLLGAMAVPAETLRLAREALAAVVPVAECANKTIVSDFVAGAGLLRAAADIAWLNLRVNASLAGAAELRDALASGAALRDDVVRFQGVLAGAAERTLDPPPDETTR